MILVSVAVRRSEVIFGRRDPPSFATDNDFWPPSDLNLSIAYSAFDVPCSHLVLFNLVI
ncbi:hypothetical protein GYH30_025506 [Glycine max]|nr:hypothetical protein GYH30_025506 [Glycine max]